MQGEHVHASMRALVQRFGSLDAVAAMIGARTGAAPSKGTLAKKMAGSLDWTVADVMALEDASASWPVTTLLSLRRQDPDVGTCDLMLQSAIVAKEAGEAIAALMQAQATGACGDIAVARVEIVEAQEALAAAVAMIDQTVEEAT